MSCLITMSQKELHRLVVIQKIRDQRLSVVQAAELLDLSRSQVHRLLQAYDQDGPAGLVSKKRSRLSNRRHSEDFRNAALNLIRERYLDFGPTLAREKLIELHQISVAKETLRQWMTEAGVWISRRERGFKERQSAVLGLLVGVGWYTKQYRLEFSPIGFAV
jgi:transposase